MDALVFTCAEACQRSYDDAVPGVVVEDLKFIVQEDDATVLITFRGSDNLDNWLRDLNVLPEASPENHLAHGGIVGGYHKLLPNVLQYIEKGKRIIVTGHSLGGGIAVLFAELLGCECVTFGAPRVYLKAGTVPLLNHLRVIQHDDPVPGLPAIFYTHDCDPITLYDNDLGVEIRDHFIESYINTLKGGMPQ